MEPSGEICTIWLGVSVRNSFNVETVEIDARQDEVDKYIFLQIAKFSF